MQAMQWLRKTPLVAEDWKHMGSPSWFISPNQLAGVPEESQHTKHRSPSQIQVQNRSKEGGGKGLLHSHYPVCQRRLPHSRLVRQD